MSRIPGFNKAHLAAGWPAFYFFIFLVFSDFHEGVLWNEESSGKQKKIRNSVLPVSQDLLKCQDCSLSMGPIGYNCQRVQNLIEWPIFCPVVFLSLTTISVNL